MPAAPHFLRACAFIAVMALQASSFASSVNFFDTEFEVGWEFQTFVDPRDNGVLDGTSGTIEVFPFGFPIGEDTNSLAHRHIVFEDDRVYTVALNTLAVYDPSVQGALGSLDFGVDAIHCCLTGNMGFYGVLEQDGNVYISDVVDVDMREWIPVSALDLLSTNFVSLQSIVDGTTPFGPDFSENGSPITFGYALSNTITDGTGMINVFHRVDNWSVTANPVPVPAALPLFASALLGGGWFARRRA